MAKFFIDRPIFTWVLAIMVMLVGALAIIKLPIAQYPAIEITANYPGADASTLQDSVTQVIEQNMNGIDNLLYMASSSDSSGTVQITLTFDSKADLDIAQVQNKLQLAMPLLPQEVQQQGVSVQKSSSRISLTTWPRISKIHSAVPTVSVTCSCLVPNTRCVSGWI